MIEVWVGSGREERDGRIGCWVPFTATEPGVRLMGVAGRERSMYQVNTEMNWSQRISRQDGGRRG